MHYEVTIGIPVYQAVDYIEKTMESALNQTYPNIEFLIVDDCGKDGSIDVVNRLKVEHPRGNDIRILCNSCNLGVGGTRNRILDEASGKFLFFLDSDDLIEPYAIQLMLDKMQEFQADIVYGSLDRIDLIHHATVKSMVLPNLCLLSEGDLADYAFKNYYSFQISVCNSLINLDFLRGSKVRFVDAVYWEDMAFTYELVTKVKRAVLSSAVTYHYQCRSGSLSHYQDREQLHRSEIMNNVSTIGYLKSKCLELSGKRYLPYLCYNLEMNSIYIICYILKYYHRIIPNISIPEMAGFLNHPVGFWGILQFRHKLIPNLVLWSLGVMPAILSISLIRAIGKIKKIL